MKQPILASRYARALLRAATGPEDLAGLEGIVVEVARALTTGEAGRFLLGPGVPPASKIEAIRAALRGADERVVGLIVAMVEKGRLPFLPEVADRFVRLSRAERGVLEAEARVPILPAEADRPSFEARIAAALGARVLVTWREDPDLIAGMRLRVGDRLYDMTARGALDAFRASVS